MDFNYTPPPSLEPFFASNARVRAIRGPIGSTKTTACIMELLRRAAAQPPGSDGKRRTRMVIVRNTLPQIKSTCLESIMQLLRPIAHYRVSDQTVQIRMGDIVSDWMLLPLDTPENINKLLSLELTMGWVSEFREIDPEIVQSVLSRVGRYPSVAVGGCDFYGVIMETNSFSEDSPWYPILEEELPSNWDYTVQPGAQEPTADWLQYLPQDYYHDLIESNPHNWVEQYVDNRITPSLSGQAVFHSSFDNDWHVSDEELPLTLGQPLIIGMDFARAPAAVICQMSAFGQLKVLKEVYATNTGVKQFFQEYVLPVLYSERFSGFSAYIVGDPSGVRRSEVGEESVFSMLKDDFGFPAVPAQTNSIDPRLRAVEKFLIGTRGGRNPAILFDGEECPELIRAMRSKYRYKKRKNGEIEDKPDKSARPWADLADALQYACLGTAQNIRGRVLRRTHTRPETQITSAGWT